MLWQFTIRRAQHLLRIAAIALTLTALAGCSQSQGESPADKLGALAAWAGFPMQSPGEAAVDKLRALADEKCHQGNQPACDTIFQIVGNKVAIESTSVLSTLTPACDAGKHDACQQLAVLQAEFSSWCATNNARACAAANIGPWPQNWDVPALVDSAKLACLSGQLKADSATCHSLENF